METQVISSPIGHLELEGSALGLRRVQKTEKPLTAFYFEQNHIITRTTQQLSAYFNKSLQQFELEYDWSGHPDFSVSVWGALLQIPYGHTCTYSDIALALAAPKAVRAVGMANRNNPIAIIVPCHRVIGKSGDLTGYFYGLDTKIQLLRHENPARYPRQMELGE